MKHLILAAALLGATATTSLAQGSWPAPPTATEVQALKTDLIAKASAFETNIKANKKVKAEAIAVDLTKLMKKHIVGTRYEAEASATQRGQIMQHMNDLEGYLLAFMRKSNDVMGNGSDLVTAVNDFIAHY